MTSGSSTRDQRQAKASALRAQVARQEARRRQAIAGGVVLVVVALAVAVFVVIQNARHDDATAGATPPANIGPGNSIVVGQAGAPVTLTAYEDFQCPVCNDYEQANTAQIDTWVKAGTVKVEYRPVSILDRASSTNYSTRALNAAAAVVNSAPGAFPAFHQALFANQPAEGTAGLTDDKLIELAVAAGAPKAPVTAAIKDGKFKGWAAKVTEDASKDGLTGTPWVKVNGTVLKEPTAANLKAAVEAAAKK